MEPVKLAVIGAGLIGKRHAEHIAREPNAKLIAVVDPTPQQSTLNQHMRLPRGPAINNDPCEKW
jgi:predicted dehydrogenase